MDTTARYYQWFMSEDPRQRLVAYEWWPAGGFMSPVSDGKLIFMHRAEPGDTWSPPIDILDGVSYYTAQALAQREGFTVEVAAK